jgi:hypothetical protein
MTAEQQANDIIRKYDQIGLWEFEAVQCAIIEVKALIDEHITKVHNSKELRIQELHAILNHLNQL